MSIVPIEPVRVEIVRCGSVDQRTKTVANKMNALRITRPELARKRLAQASPCGPVLRATSGRLPATQRNDLEAHDQSHATMFTACGELSWINWAMPFAQSPGLLFHPCVSTMVIFVGSSVVAVVKLPFTNVLSCEGEIGHATSIAGVLSSVVGVRVVGVRSNGCEAVNCAASLMTEP